MKSCPKCHRNLPATDEICPCGAWLPNQQAVSPTPLERAIPKRMQLWMHGLIMLIAAPLIWGLVFGLLNGFSVPQSATIAISSFFTWLGSASIAIIIAWLTLLLRKPYISWSVLLGLIGFFAYGVYYTSNKIENIPLQKPEPARHSGTVLAKNNHMIVSSAVESFSGPSAHAITDELINEFEKFIVLDTEERIKIRAKEAGEPVVSVGLTASSLKFSQNGENAIITEVNFPKHFSNPPNMKVIWWIQNNEFKRVQCADLTGASVNYRRGKCGRQVEDTFGYTHWYMD